MTEPTTDKIPLGTALSPEQNKEFRMQEVFYLTWARESIKNSIELANDILKQLVTLNTALLGGASVLLNKELIDPTGKLFIVFLFFLALIFSFFGMLPFEAPWSRKMDDIRADKLRALKHKQLFIKLASGCMALGFGVAFAGFVFILCHA